MSSRAASIDEKFAVRYRNKHGNVTTRHVDANNPSQASKKVKGKGRFVISVRRVRAEEIIGNVVTKKLIADVVGKIPAKKMGILENDTTLDSIVFNQKFQVKEDKIEVDEPLWYKKNKESK